jgi:hypothetical protein
MFCLSSGADSLLAGVRRLCLALPEVTVGLTHGGETWFDELVAEDPRRFFVPRFGGYDWVGMRLDLQPDGPGWQEVAEILTDAYRQVAPKFLIAGWTKRGRPALP